MSENKEDETFYAINPVVGFRGWRVRKTPQGKWGLFSLIMSSWINRFIYYIGIRKKVPMDKYGYWPSKVHIAACPINDSIKKWGKTDVRFILEGTEIAPHNSPDINCTCGIYTLNDLNLWELRTADVIGAVKLWGTILQHTNDRGSRAEHAEILALSVHKKNRPLLTYRVKKICKEYDIPFVNVKDLPKIALEHGEPLLDIEVNSNSSPYPKRLRNIRRLFWSLWAFNIVFYNHLLFNLPQDLYWLTGGPEIACLVIIFLGSFRKLRRLLRLDK